MMDVRILALMKPGGRATALGIRQSQKLASGFAPPKADVQNINKTSLSRQGVRFPATSDLSEPKVGAL